jgi:hypothetical protein
MKKNFTTKLQIKKTTVSNLTGKQMNEVRGGILLTITCSENDYTCGDVCSAAGHCLNIN